MNRNRAIRARRLIEGLINEAHRNWPGVPFVIRLPTGEEMLLPVHGAAASECTAGHEGYLREQILPYCEVSPTRVRRGYCSIRPVAGIGNCSQVPSYVLDLKSGALSSSAAPDGKTSKRKTAAMMDQGNRGSTLLLS